MLSGEARNRVALKNKHEREAVKECTPCEWVSFGLTMCMLGAPLLCSEVSSDLQEHWQNGTMFLFIYLFNLVESSFMFVNIFTKFTE